MAAMDPEAGRYVRALLDAHDEAFRALRAAGEAMNRAIEGMGAANKAHGGRSRQPSPRNRAAIDLLQHLRRNGG